MRLIGCLLALALLHVRASFHVRFSCRIAQPHLARTVAPTLLADGEARGTDEVATAKEKRMRAEQLALEAERAALEAERLELEIEELKLAQQLLQDEDDAAPSTPTLASTLDASPVVGTTAETGIDTTVLPTASPAEASQEQSPPLNALGLNFSSGEDGEVAGLPPPPPLTYGSIAEVVKGKSEAELQLSEEQISAARSQVFDLESFYVMKVEQTFLGTIFRGNLRTNSSAAYAKIVASAAATPELANIAFILLDDPITPTLDSLDAGEERRPVVLALPSEVTRIKQDGIEYVTAVAATFMTIITTLGFALSTFILADGGQFLDQLEQGDTSPLDAASPIGAGIGMIFTAHELAHLAAAKQAKVRIGWPLPLPSLQLGLFGCITRLTAFPPNRQALFDVAIAGPAVGAALSLLVYFVGIGLSIDLTLPPTALANIDALEAASRAVATGSDPAISAAAASTAASTAASSASTVATRLAELSPVVPISLLESSLLLGFIANVALPQLADYPAVALHPFAVVGFVGTLVNALQLLPIGRLDGGRVAYAVLGQSSAGLFSGLSLLALGLSTIFGGDNPVLLFFGLVIIFLQRSQEIPALDDLTDVSDGSKLVAALALFFAMITLLPF